MQAEEQPTGVSGQRSKAAAKRARKKAARQQAATAASNAHIINVTGLAVDPATLISGSAGEAEAISGSSPPAGADAAQLDAAQATASSSCDDPSVLEAPLQSTAADHMPAAQSDWWRCPLSGRVMRDPVLYGSSGHSFEREALEEWSEANPGVEPLSRQPLPPGSTCALLPNHALRNMIQQLRLG